MGITSLGRNRWVYISRLHFTASIQNSFLNQISR